MSALENDLVRWMDRQIRDLPDSIDLLYLESSISPAFDLTCSFLGYEFAGEFRFDPEDSGHLDVLSGPYEWESGMNAFETRLGADQLEPDRGGFDEKELLARALSGSTALA